MCGPSNAEGGARCRARYEAEPARATRESPCDLLLIACPPAGSRVLREEGGAHFVGLERYEDLEALLAALRDDGVTIRELALLEADLEDVFLKIMGGDVRQATAEAA